MFAPMQLVTPRVVAIAVAIDTMSWIISFQVFFLVSVLIRKINFKMFIKRTSFLKDCALKKAFRTVSLSTQCF